MKQNKNKKNLYLQNIIEAYNPYNNLNASERAAMSYEKQRNNLTTIGTQGCFDIRAKRLQQNWQSDSIIYKNKRKKKMKRKPKIAKGNYYTIIY